MLSEISHELIKKIINNVVTLLFQSYSPWSFSFIFSVKEKDKNCRHKLCRFYGFLFVFKFIYVNKNYINEVSFINYTLSVFWCLTLHDDHFTLFVLQLVNEAYNDVFPKKESTQQINIMKNQQTCGQTSSLNIFGDLRPIRLYYKISCVIIKYVRLFSFFFVSISWFFLLCSFLFRWDFPFLI